MSWKIVTDEWRLKLLAIGLAVLMLGAVAFSQNPPTSGSLTIPIRYVNQPSDLIMISPPTKTSVTYTGLADVIRNVNSSNLLASVDLSHATTGPAVRLNLAVKTPTGVTALPPAPIFVNIDTRQGKDVPVTVIAHPAAGWTITRHDAICGSSNSSCTVHFDGPASWETNLTAYVDFPGLVNVNSINSSNWPVQLQNSNGGIDLSSCQTSPCANLDVTTVAVHIEAVPGSTSSTVALLDSPYSQPPASGYRVTAVTITPGTVIVSGDPVALGRIRNITLPPVSLAGRTSDATFQVAIPYPDGITGNVANATVKYSISPNPNATPSP
jgi:YbbR domain-containing protein